MVDEYVLLITHEKKSKNLNGIYFKSYLLPEIELIAGRVENTQKLFKDQFIF
jgi:hypothetical protein